MKQTLLRLFILFVIVALNPIKSRASHAAGGEIAYEWVSDSTYRFYFKFYRDCSGAAEPGNNSIQLCYQNTCNSFSSWVYLNKITKLPDSTVNGAPVTQGCPGTGTKCTNTNSTVPGYREWWYSNTVTLPSRCNFWKFSVAIGNRNASVNLSNAQNTIFYAEATLNNLNAQGNSSPYFSVKPVPSICINQPYTYNNGGVDPNSDSLRFELVQPQQSNGACPPTVSNNSFASGSPSYNLSTNPIQTNNSFTIDGATGQLTFTPTLSGASTLTVRIKEYRNNVLIGTVMRDIQVQVIACSVASPIVNTVSNSVVGGNLVNGRIEACAGVPLTFCFDLKSSDTAAVLVANDNHTAAAPGSTVNYVGQYTDSIRGCFSWTAGTLDTGLRVFSVTAKDSTCLSPGVIVAQTFVLPIYIWPITDIIRDTTICYGDSVSLLAVGGSSFTWSVLTGGSPITSLSCTTCKQPWAKPTLTTHYVVSNSAVQYCAKNSDTATVTVVDIRYDTLQATSNSPVCSGDTLKLFSTSVLPGYTYYWTGPSSFTSSLQNPYIPSVPLTAAGNYILKSRKGGCYSLPDTVAVTIKTSPASPVVSNNGPLCSGSTLNLTASTISGATYTWSGPSSFTSTTQNPSITNAQPINGGTYSVYTSTANGCNSPVVYTNAQVTDKPVITSVTASNPTTCGGAGTITLTGLIATTSYTVDYKKNGVAQTPLLIAANSSGNVVMTGLLKATYSQIKLTLNGCSSDTTIPVIISDPAKPAITSISSNTPICQGDTLKLYATADSAGVTWAWTGPGSFTSSSQNPVIANAATTQSGTYSLTIAKNGCTSNASTTSVTVNAKPANTTASSNTPVCSGNTLSLFATTSAGATYSWSGPNSFTSTLQNPSIASADTFATGRYIVVAMMNGCYSKPDSTYVTVYQTPRIDSAKRTNPTTCLGTDGTITLYGLLNNTGYTLNYKKNGVAQTALTPTSNGSGVIVVTGLGKGTYSQITVTLNGCTSDTTQQITLTDPSAPTIKVLDNTPICEGDTLKLTANPIETGVSFSWTGPFAFTSTLENPIITYALSIQSGTYVLAATKNNCTAYDSVVSVIKPLPAKPTVSNNGPLCSGATLNLTASNVSGAGYNWSGPNSFTSTLQNPSIINVDTPVSGVYRVYTDLNGCVSATDSTTVVVYHTPVISGFSYSSPTTCGGTQGSITLNGLVPNTTYSVSYKKNGSTQTPVAILANGTGNVVMTGLGAAVYTLVKVTLNGCSSDTIAPVTLINPSAPLITTSNNTPICQGDTIKLFGTSDSTGVTWSWGGPMGYTSSQQNPVITNAVPLQSGKYYLSVSKNGCTSLTDSTTVTVKPTPATPTAGSNSPVCSGNALNLTAATVTGASYSWTGPKTFISGTQNPSIAGVDTLESGDYIVTATVNGCISFPDTTTVVIYHTPDISGYSFTNPLTCGGTEGSITLNGLVPNTTYSVDYKKNGVQQSTANIVSNGTGNVIITGLMEAVYTQVHVTLNGCLSDTIVPVSLVGPIKPVVTPSNNTPICQSDTIKLFATADSTGVTWSWTGPLGYTSILQNPTITNALPTQSGWYYLSATKNGCTSVADSTQVTVKPTPSTPVAGNNGPLCSGSTLQLTASTITNATYSWNGAKSYTSTLQNPSIAGVDTLESGDYIVTATVNGCISFPDTTTVVINHTPDISGYSFTNPLTCGGTEGSITLNGLVPNTTYSVDYKKNGVQQSTANILSNVTGNLTITGLSEAVYTQVHVTLNGCLSDTIVPVSLVGPIKPVVTASNNTPICQSDTIKLFATADSTGVTWSWTGPLGYTSILQNPTITNALPTQSGWYYLSATKNGCTSVADSTQVTVKPTPSTPVAGNNGPLCSGSTLLLTASTILNATYSWTGVKSFNSNLQNPSIASIDTLEAGDYIVRATVNGCVSFPDTTTVVIYHTPDISGYSFTNPTTCGGTEGSITLNGLVPNTAYSVDYKKNGVQQSTANILSNVTGNLTITGLSEAVYTQVHVTLNGCLSDTIVPVSLVGPIKPIVTATNNTPICQSDTIKLFATADSTGVTWSWTGPLGYTSILQNPTITNVLPTQSGWYYLSATKNGCTSVADSTHVTVKPTPATPVAGSNSPVCSGNILSLTASAISNATYNWIGPLSFNSALQNPNISAVDTPASGDYIVTATVNGCVSFPDTAVVIVYHTPVISGYTFTNPTTCSGTEGTITLSGLVPNTTYAINYRKNGVVQPTAISTSNGAGKAVLGGLTAGVYTRVTVTLNGCASDTIAPVTLTDPSKPVVLSATNNTPICQPDTIKLYTTADSTGVTWSWTGPLGYTSTLQNPMIANSAPGMSGDYIVTATKNNCTSLPDTTTVLVKPKPAIPTASTNAPICSGNTLLLFAATVSGANYTWTGPGGFSSTLQNPSIANAQTGHSGTYTVVAEINGCYSLSSSVAVTVNPLPAPVVNGYSITNPSTCLGADGSIVINGLNSSTLYTLNYKKNGIAQTQTTVTTSIVGSFAITNLTAGVYTSIVVTSPNGCLSDPVGPLTLVDPATPVISFVSKTNPTTCLGSDGTITIGGLDTGLLYTVNYNKAAVSQAPVLLTSSALGQVTIPGLTAGIYNAIRVTIYNCTSNSIDSIKLVDPNLPVANATNSSPVCEGGSFALFGVADSSGVSWSWTGPLGFTSNLQSALVTGAVPAQSGDYILTVTKNNCTSLPDTTTVLVKPTPPTPVASSNTPVCSGNTLNLFSSVVTNATYSWAGPGGYVSPLQNPSIALVDTPQSGDYILIATVNGCNSVSDTTTVIVYHTPEIDTSSFTHPTTCGGAEGTITLKGLVKNVNYTVDYKKNGVAQSPLLLPSDAGGQVIMTTLSAGWYSQITVTLNNCTSDTIAPILLVDPNRPVIHGSTNAPVCQGDTLRITASSDSANCTWLWTGPLSYTSTLQNSTILNANPSQSGNYIVTATKNNCTSLPDTVPVQVKPTPQTPVAGSNSPLCSSGSILNLTATTINNAFYFWSGPDTFTSVIQNPVRTTVDTPMAGYYKVYVTVAGCVSATDSTFVAISHTPHIDSVYFTNPSTCNGKDGSIILTGLERNKSYMVDYDYMGVPELSSTQIATGSGIVIIPSLSAGIYSRIRLTLNGCTSDTTKPVTLKDPSAPIAFTSNNTAICQGDTVELYGSSDSTGVTWSWTGPLGFTSASQNPSILNALPTHSGPYVLRVTKHNCTSAPDTTVVIVMPTPPTPNASSNSPVCSGNSLKLMADTIFNAVYSWTGPAGYTSPKQNPVLFNVDTPRTGLYIVIASVNGCVSAPDTTAVVVYHTPVISSYTYTNPTVCNGTDGRIILNGMVANTTYAVNYKKNGVVQTTWPILSNGTGQVVMTGLNAGRYSVITVSLNNCPSDTTGQIILQDPGVPVVTASNNTPICQSDTIKLFATSDSSGVVWSWTGPLSYTSSVQNPMITGAIPTQSGVYTVTATKNGCTSLPVTTTVTVKPTPPTPTAGSNSPVCSGNPLNLTSLTIANATYSWTGPAGFTSTLQNPTLLGVDTPRKGRYVVVATVNGCKSAADTTNVIIYHTPVISGYTFTNPTTCNGTNGSITLNGQIANTTYAVNYKKNGVTQATWPILSNGAGQVLMNGLTAGVYSQITVSLNNCPSDTIVPVTLRDPGAPIVTASNNTPICQGDTIKLFATSDSSGVTWAWSGPLGFSATVQNPFIAGSIPGQSGVYTVTASKNNCTSLPITTTVTVKPQPPRPSPTNNGPLCDGGTLVLNSLTITNATYSWVGPGSFTSTLQNPTIIGMTLAKAGKYSVIATVNGCSSFSDTTLVVVNPIPPPPIVNPWVYYCQDDTAVPLTATGLNLLWYTTLTGGTGSATAPTPQTIVPGNTVYYVSQTISNCESPRIGINVQVKPKPAPPIAMPDSFLYCQYNNTDTLTAIGTNLLWYTQAVGGTGSVKAPAPSSATAGVFNWYVSLIGANGCESNRDTVTVTISPELKPDIQSDKIALCEYDSIEVNDKALYDSVVQYRWDFDNGIKLSGDTSGPYHIKWDAPGSKWIIVKVNTSVCVSYDSLRVDVYPIPVALFELKDNACVNEVIDLLLKPVAKATYQWEYDGAEYLDEVGNYTKLRWNNDGRKRVQLIVTSEFGCVSKPYASEIDVHNNPDITIETISRNDICAGDTIQIKTRLYPTYRYEWSSATAYLEKHGNEVTAQVNASGAIHITATNEWSCVTNDSVYINTRPCCEIYLPDAFTPNNDGRNDKFRILSDGNHEVLKFIIVNRWGQKVFETNNEKIGWDGMFKGIEQDMGVYDYYIKYKCTNNNIIEKKGQVTLLR